MYCALAQSGFHGSDLTLDRLAIVEQIRKLGVKEVQVSGHGESTKPRDKA